MGDSVIYAITLDYMAYVLDGMGKAEEAMGKLYIRAWIYIRKQATVHCWKMYANDWRRLKLS